MKSSGKIGLGLAALSISSQVFAQVPGYQVSWGTEAVPLSPWLNAMIVLMLILTTYAFMRKRAGRGLMLLAGTLLVGALSMHTEKDAISLVAEPTYTIATPSGSVPFSCTQTHYLGTSVVGGVTLTVTPFGVPMSTGAQGQVTPSAALINECMTGTHLLPGALCYLCAT